MTKSMRHMALLIALMLNGHQSFCGAQSAASPSLRFVTGTLTEPGRQAYPVRIYQLGNDNKLQMAKELIHANLAGDRAPSGIRAINIIGTHLFIDYPYEVPTSTLVVSTISGESEGVVVFSPAGLGGDTYNHLFYLSRETGSCDLWDVPKAKAMPAPNGQGMIWPPGEWRSVCVGGTSGTVLRVGAPSSDADWEYPGTPGGPANGELTFLSAVAGNLVTRQNGQPNTLIQRIPPQLMTEIKATGNPQVRLALLKASNEKYLVLSPAGGTDPLLVFDKAMNSWSKLVVEGNDSLLRIFGDWMAAIVQSAKLAGADHCGEEDANDWRIPPGELDRAVKEGRVSAPASPKDNPPPPHRTQPATGTTPAETGIPNASEQFASNRGCTDDITGRLVLYNLADHRKIVIEGMDKDIEAVDFLNPELMLLRSGDKLYLQPIHGSSLGARQLIAQDSDVPQIHWAFQMH